MSNDGTGHRSQSEIERDLGIGAMVDLRLLHAGRAASLFRARQVPTGRLVAVKVLHDELSSDTGQRFDRERAITGQLSGHTAIVPLFDTGTTSDDEPYLVMPFYRRGSLADLMERYGPLAWREAAFLIEPVAVTLAEVHGQGLVHRNVKPGNVLLTDFLLPRMADFGMCLPLGQISTAATLLDGHYPAPETTTVGPAAATIDVYGLGAMLWGLLVGRPPELPAAERASLATARQLGGAVPGPPTDGGYSGRGRRAEDQAGEPGRPSAARHGLREICPEPIAELIERSVSTEPADRPDTAAVFVTELRRAVGQADRGTGTGLSATFDLRDNALSVSAESDRQPPTASPPTGPTVPDATAASEAEPARAAEATSRPAPADTGPIDRSLLTDTAADATGSGSASTADEPDGERPSPAERATAGTQVYLLLLVAFIAAVIVVMVGAAISLG